MQLLLLCLISLLSEVKSEHRFEAKVFAIVLPDEQLPFSFDTYSFALKFAEKTVNELYNNFRVNVTIRKSSMRCDSSAAPVYVAEEYYRRNLSAILGPSCTRGLEPVARMASYWNVPLCTAGGIDMKFKDKNVFQTLTRITFSIDQIGNVVSHVFKHFRWKNIALIVDETEDEYSSLKECLRNSLQDDINLNVFTFTRNIKSFTRILERSSRVSRIFVIVAGGETVRKILLQAYQLKYANGHYAYLAIDFKPDEEIFHSYSWYRRENTTNDEVLFGTNPHSIIFKAARKIFDSLLVLSIRQPSGPKYEAFAAKLKAFTENQTKIDNNKVRVNFVYFMKKQNKPNSICTLNLIITGAFDCIVTYAWALNRTISNGGSPYDGYTVSREMWNTSFSDGVIEDFVIDANGDRKADFTLKDFSSTSEEMTVVATYKGLIDSLRFIPGTAIHWPSPGNKPPLDVPKCGFTGDAPHCQKQKPILSSLRSIYHCESTVGLFTVYIIIAIGSLIVLSIIVSLALKYYKSLVLENEWSSLWWKVKWDDIIFEEKLPRSFGTLVKSEEHLPVIAEVMQRRESSRNKNSSRIFETVPATYKGMQVAVKRLRISKLIVNTELLVEMHQMRDINHENLIRFIGVCPEENRTTLLCEYSSRGCLADLLQNDEITIDWPFRFSIIADIIEGMCFLHSSPIAFHGRLKSTNCVIDGRFVVKIANFGLRELRRQSRLEAGILLCLDATCLLWTAPEHLRGDPQSIGSQKGDVYSFAVILQEIILRSSPFETLTKYTKYRTPLTYEGTTPPFRPEISRNDCPSDLLDLVHQCWEEDPQKRPSFPAIRSILKRTNIGYDGDNFLENLLSRMEQYTNNLEQLVEQRTNAFLEEKQKSEELLYEILPRTVADRLKNGESVEPENFECVTICFLDIVGFTRLSAESTPMQVVTLLNDLYTCFDNIITGFDVYKVETIGDAYMVVSGCPIPNKSRHAKEIARMSLALLDAIDVFEVRHKPDQKIQLRIGIHSGPCVAGVVGIKMPRYCLLGDTVNIAIRMESSGQAMKIHVSEETQKLLEIYGTFVLEQRGLVEIK
ncbi:atrial natriuretic peptide receptor 1-like protein, partial [Leptotrombidium deliense]